MGSSKRIASKQSKSVTSSVRKTSKALPFAYSALALAMMPAASSAAPVTSSFNIFGVQNSTQYLGDNDTGMVQDSGHLVVNSGYGVDVLGMASSLTNAGEITATGGYSGVVIENGANLGLISNSGSITGDSGIYAAGDLNGDITNSGTVTGTSHSALRVDGLMTGNVINSGTLVGNDMGVDFYGGATTTANGNYMSLIGNINNSGTIEAGGSTTAIYLAGGMKGSITNSGTIKSSGGSGIYIYGSAGMVGSLNNSGTISSYDTAFTVYDGAMTGDINNSGKILSANGMGLYLDGSTTTTGGDYASLIGNITNTGTLHSYDTAIYTSESVKGNIVNKGLIQSDTDYGIYIDNNLLGSFTNSGTLQTYYTGLYVDGYVDGAITNSGTITSLDDYGIHVNSYTSSASAAGNYIGVNGSVTNTGTIDSYDAGIYIDYGVNGAVYNSGTIKSSDSYGIYIGGVVNGDVTNDGTITSYDTGLYLDGTVNGNVTNNGTITSTDEYGIYINGSTTSQSKGARVAVNGNVVNNGTINSSYSGYEIYGVVNGNVTNNGTINAADEYGYYIDGYSTTGGVQTAVNGNVTNTGTINSYYSGYEIYGVVNGSMTNSGTIKVADDYGIYVDGDTTTGGVYTSVNGSVTNSGTIDSYDTGYYLYGMINGDFTNSGNLTSKWGYGLYVSDGGTTTGGQYIAVNGNVTNTGTIDAYDTGIYLDGGVNGNIYNSGTITSQDSYGIAVYGVMNGDVTNDGTITSWETGLYLQGTINGNFTNNGTITSGYYEGVDMSGSTTSQSKGADIAINGDIVNNGTIHAYSTAYDISGVVNGNITNNGTLYSKYDYGYSIDGSSTSNGANVAVNGDITNNGTINAYDSAYDITGTVNGTVTNNGTIISRDDYGYDISGGNTSNGTQVAVNGDITNKGTINSYYSAYYISGVVNGNISNSGTITVADDYGYDLSGDTTTNGNNIAVNGDISNSGSIAAYSTGYDINGIVNGNITNSGSITSTFGHGYYLHAGVTSSGRYVALKNGSITNTGTITSSETAIYIYGGGMDGNIVNQGTITATSGGGVEMYNNQNTAQSWNGDFVNSGKMLVTDSGVYTDGINWTGSATNSGIIQSSDGLGIDVGRRFIYNYTNSTYSYIGGNFTGNITNSGTINAYDSGVYVGALMTGDFTNSGTIKSQWNYGYYVGGTTTTGGAYVAQVGNITNTGTITSYDAGIYLSDQLQGSIDNSGGITAADSYGIYVGGDVSGSVTNSGTIQSTDTGIYIDGNLGGDFTNSGTITSSLYRGVTINGDAAGTVTNSGTIAGHSTGLVVYGTYNVVNTGTISGQSGHGTAVRLGTGTSAGTFTQNAGLVNGAVILGGGNDTMIVNGGRITGNLLDSGGTDSLAFNAPSFTIGGNVSGFETVNFNKGTTTFGGNLTGASTVTVASGANLVLNNAGITAGAFDNNGTVTANNATASTYTQAATGTLNIPVANATSYGSLNVTNAADLGGGTLKVTLQGTSYLADGSNLTSVVATGSGVSNVPATVKDNSATLSFTSTVNGNNVDLTANRVATFSQLTGGNALAKTLDQAIANGYTAGGKWDPIIGQLDAQATKSGVSNAVKQFSTENSGVSLQGAKLVSSRMNNLITQRVHGQAGTSSGGAMADTGVWLQGFTGNANQDASTSTGGYDAKTNGFVLGADRGVSDTLRLGLAYSHATTDITDAGSKGHDLNMDSNYYSVYSSWQGGSHWYLDGNLSYGDHSYDSKRHISAVSQTASAKYNGKETAVGAEFGYNLGSGDLNITPLASLRYSRLALDSYQESGAGSYDLKADSQTLATTTTGLGVRLSKDYTLSGGSKLKPEASLTWKHDLGDVTKGTNVSLTNGGSFTSSGLDLKRDTASVGLGVNWQKGDRWTFRVDYEGDFRSGYTANAGALKVRYDF